MKVKQLPNQWPEWRSHPVRDLDGTDMVHIAVDKGDSDYDRIRVLSEIVGRLVDKLPEKDRIEVCGLQYSLERVK
jgi:hypothetical protein